MGSRKTKAMLAATALIGAGAVALPAANADDTAERKAKTVTVKVADDFFSPVDVKIRKGDKVKWKWDPENGNSHNVTLQKGPQGVKKKDFTSITGVQGIKFKRKFEKKGTYDFVCTIHATVMTGTVKVKK